MNNRNPIPFPLVLALAVTLVLFATIGTNAQSAQPMPPIAQGKTAKIRLATPDETNQFAASMASMAKDARVDSMNNPPAPAPEFAIFATGEAYYDGVTAIAMNVSTIHAGTFFGATTPGRFHYAWYTEDDIPPGYIWYSLENNRKLAFTEAPSVVDYQMTTILNGNIRTYDAFVNMGIQQDEQTEIITDGYGTNDGTPMIYLYGDFNTAFGILVRNSSNNLMVVPRDAMRKVRPGIISINLSKIPYAFIGAGGYRITFVDARNQSDNGFQVRVPKASSANDYKHLSPRASPPILPR